MSLKILGGVMAGLCLHSPKGDAVRPTAIRLKRRFFDAFQSWEGLLFFDLCAGSGAVGLEAWSRGAVGLTLIESNPKVQKVLRQNVDLLQEKMGEDSDKRRVEIVSTSVDRWVQDFKRQYQSWKEEDKDSAVIFFDPPYENHKLYDKVLETFFKEDWFKGFLVVESDEQKGQKLSEIEKWGTKSSRVFTQGTSFLAVFPFS